MSPLVTQSDLAGGRNQAYCLIGFAQVTVVAKPRLECVLNNLLLRVDVLSVKLPL
jgi:hypothetical protein